MRVEASTQLSYKGVTSDYCVPSPSEIVKQPVLFSHAARGWVWIYSVTHCATVTAKYKNATLLRASPQFFHPPTVLRSIKHTVKSVLYADSFRYYSAFEYEVFVLQTKCKFEKTTRKVTDSLCLNSRLSMCCGRLELAALCVLACACACYVQSMSREEHGVCIFFVFKLNTNAT